MNTNSGSRNQGAILKSYNDILLYLNGKNVRYNGANARPMGAEDALFWCIRNSSDSGVIEMLIDRGVKLWHVDDSMLRKNVEHGNIRIVRYLINLGCDPAYNNNEMIWRAALNNNLPMMKLLIESGCNLCFADMLYIYDKPYIQMHNNSLPETLGYLLDLLPKRDRLRCFSDKIVGYANYLTCGLQHKTIIDNFNTKHTLLKSILRPRSMSMQMTYFD
jgi:ankyrin repeat protein